MSSYSRDDWNRKSWINDMVSSPKFAKDLNSIYADDIIQSITEDQEFSTIEAAITDMRTRVGLSDGEVGEIRRLATAKLNPSLQGAKERILNLPAIKLAALIKAYTTECGSCKQAPCGCAVTLMTTVRQAMDELGIEALADLHDNMIAGELPAGLKKWQEEHGKKSEDEEEDKEEKAEDKEEKEASACSIVKTAQIDNCSDCGAPIENGGIKGKCEACSKGVTAGALDLIKKATNTENTTIEGDNMNKKANIEKWNDFFKKKSWYQSEALKVEKVISGNPADLKIPGADEVYPRLDPKGGDVRNTEQKAFEGAAKATKSDLEPASQLAEKKKLQRARWNSFMKKADVKKSNNS
jgi:hypothetical protein